MNTNNLTSYSDAFAIEQGYFIFTMMPSLKCSLNCPHCYLTKEQRRDDTIMSLENLQSVCNKVDAYYQSRGIHNKRVVAYWYGGEPTEMGLDYTRAATEIINSTFNSSKGYDVRHIFLTSLINIDRHWFDFFREYADNYVQTSFDGLMRGQGYVKRWRKNVLAAKDYGLSVGTISVVNNTLFEQGPVSTLDYLHSLGIQEASFLPFMLNAQNNTGSYGKFAPRMDDYSQFMIRLTERFMELRESGEDPPEIGQLRFIVEQAKTGQISNIAGQTLFLLPNGDFVLPDYKDGYLEYQKPFGNILEQDFNEILTSLSRREYLRRQVRKNDNPECLSCNHTDKCIMEFWKPNRDDDDCFGARNYVDWIVNKGLTEPGIFDATHLA